jgi:transglutaminase-like putative cysteine protease
MQKMKTSFRDIRRSCRPLCVFIALVFSVSLKAQDRDKYDSIAVKYKGEHAVYSDIAARLVISIENGALVAKQTVTLEKLFLTDQSLSNYNKEFFVYSDFNELINYHGVAYLPNGKTYKREDNVVFGAGRPRDYIFYDDTRVVEGYYSGLTKNAITETRYTIKHTDIHMLSGFEFQDVFQNLPVANASFEVVAPAEVNMEFALKGLNTSMIKQTKEERNGKVHYLFTAANMPAIKDFESVPSWRYYVPHVIPYISSFRLEGYKKDSVISKSTDHLYKYLYNYVRSINLKTSTDLDNLVTDLTKNDISQRDKAAHIYRWVQEHIHYVAIENGLEGFVPRPADTVLKRKYGDCKDMASIISAMCRKAGMNAYFTWIGTDDLPYNIDDLPLNINFNHMICAVQAGDEWLFLDGTHKLLPCGGNRGDIQGKQALIAMGDNNYKVVTIPIEPADKNVTIDSSFITIEGKTIAGTLQQSYKGYDAWNLGYGVMYNKKDDEREKFVKSLTARGSDKFFQNKYEINANNTGDKDVIVNAKFTVEDYVQRVGKQCFVNMNLNHHFEDSRIDVKDRNVPTYYDHKTKRKEVVVLEIPKGYKVSYLPHSVKGSLGDQWSYSINYKADKKKITLTKEYELNTLSIGTDKFAANNKIVDDLKKVYNESVVLTTN